MCENYVELCAIYEIGSKKLKVYGIILLQFVFKSEVREKREIWSISVNNG